MSEFTFVTVIKEKSMDEIKKCVEGQGLEGFVFPVNQSWNGAVLENEMEKGELYAKSFSQALDTHALYFTHCEDHGWSFDLYRSGEEIAHLLVDYEGLPDDPSEDDDSSIDTANLQALNELICDKDAWTRLLAFLDDSTERIKDLFSGVEYFKQAFGFEMLEWVSYNYFSNSDPDMLDESGAVRVTKSN